jgi:hypothetical protein
MGFLLSSKIGRWTLKPGRQREGDLLGARLFFMDKSLKDHTLQTRDVNEVKV